jgi:hypothetical protein
MPPDEWQTAPDLPAAGRHLCARKHAKNSSAKSKPRAFGTSATFCTSDGNNASCQAVLSALLPQASHHDGMRQQLLLLSKKHAHAL